MKPVAIVENDHLLPGTGWVGRILDARGIPWRLVRGHAGETADLDVDALAGLVVLGGRQHAWEEDEHPQLRHEREAMAAGAERDLPILGCCLGGQVLARALGGIVHPAPAPEHGWLGIAPTPAAATDPLFRHASAGDRVYLWHLDAFTLPEGAVHLATSVDAPVQAFRYRNAWALQFHPEVDLDLQTRWFDTFPDAAAAVGADQAAMAAEATEREGAQTLFATALIDAFADVVVAHSPRR
jgi:GMP synthase-like glutamine amidotransferase